MEKSTAICQNCKIPMRKETDYGTENDGTRNEKYCCYCYQNGNLTTYNESDFCQSCSMPIKEEVDFGTEADGSRSTDYCHYCYQSGAFTAPDDMNFMIEACVPHVSKGNPYPDEETARKAMRNFFPQLKRWKAKS